MSLDDRKAAILRAVVREYIETAQPVGSAHVSRSGLGVSPATVRNEMAFLEREGYLTQPHTSAGRVPTDKGYRFFVDQLSTPSALAPVQRRQVGEFFAHAHGEIEQMLHDTSRLLANLTDYAAVVVAPGSESATLRSVQLVGLAPHVVLAVVVLSSGSVAKRTLELSDDVGDQRVAAASAHLAAHLTGRTLAALGDDIPAIGDPVTDALVHLVQHAFVGESDSESDQVFVGGAARMVAAFDAVDTVRRVLAILEQQYVVVTLVQEVLDRGLSVSIGTEHGVESLAECAIVVAPYDIEGETAGSIGVLGPTRMHYPEAMAAVAVVSERLSRRLSEA
jgi:heat-inducible transcriptional repressor